MLPLDSGKHHLPLDSGKHTPQTPNPKLWVLRSTQWQSRRLALKPISEPKICIFVLNHWASFVGRFCAKLLFAIHNCTSADNDFQT